MSFLEVLENEIPENSKTQFKTVHDFECEEVLDNLGYILLNRNNDDQKLASGEFEQAIKTFRQEYAESYGIFHELDEFSVRSKATLSEGEIAFMHQLSSLEGEFNLHQYTLKQINNNKLLSRALNFRLNILSIFDIAIDNHVSKKCVIALNQLETWTGKQHIQEIIQLIGDVKSLSEIISIANSQSDSLSHYFSFFNAQRDRFMLPTLNNAVSNWAYFEQGFFMLDNEYPEALQHLRANRSEIKPYQNSALNQLQLRLVQIRLWLLGTYEGKLDNDIGPLTVESVKDAIIYAFDKTTEKGEKHLVRRLFFFMGDNTWVLNVNYLFQYIFPMIEGKEQPEEKQAESLSEKIAEMLDNVKKPEDKQAILKNINQRLDQKSKQQLTNKVKTKASKFFLKSVGHFFKKIASFVKTAVNKVIGFLSKLFDKIKNSLHILSRELKKITSMMKIALKFFFSKRIITTGENNEISTDYDFNFDSSTKVYDANDKLIQEHIQKINKIAEAMNEMSDFLGLVVKIMIKVFKGPYGWIQLGIEVIHNLFKENINTKVLFKALV